ncbi:hypothetical protein QBC33DRAFT_188545 [Phialemonium atrogriseum]|uniref:Uncharacterized protein n=1 Tax=Phialemonium atrogriseum TaxID=1093897 RepID=A0AAJ0BWW7_9PEZI|nr:uncharacterized protein QBC33DRAFT_188545 [Phialemonium atrogriseum]KAK1764557.1 hypothetical protein QBC33DRAFT_188545 [Phialemonium atrogriseum]
MEWKCPLCPTLAFLSYACAIFRTRPPQESFKSTGGRTRGLTLYLRGYGSPQEVQDCACVRVPELCLLGYVFNDTAVDCRDDQRSGGVCGEGFSIEPEGQSTLASGMPKLEASQSRKCPSGIYAGSGCQQEKDIFGYRFVLTDLTGNSGWFVVPMKSRKSNLE